MNTADPAVPTIAVPIWTQYLLMNEREYELCESTHKQIATELSGHDEQAWQIVLEAVGEGVDTARCKRAWRQVLTQRHLMLCSLEACLWDRLGAREAVADDTAAGYGQTVDKLAWHLRLQQAEQVPLLLAQLVEQGVMDEEQSARIADISISRFDDVAERLVELAFEREQIALERLDALHLHWHTPPQSLPLVVIEGRIGAERVVQAFSLLDERVESVDSHELGLPEGTLVPDLVPARDHKLLQSLGIAAVSYEVSEGMLAAEVLAQALTVYYAPLLD
jgi:hypothetical protein